MESAISYDTPSLLAYHRSFIEEQFESIVRDEANLKEWDESLLSHFTKRVSGSLDDWCDFANWLDIMWFAHHTKNSDLRKTAAQNLRTLINVENVVGIITGAHTAGEKEVRKTAGTVGNHYS
jgi:hypothetical protein